ncbi:hypothetical protein BU16DRAFT_275724 [Lophium mytilinum]|uniref:Uncharacterized protein n=1 Tax=Lophium mytilinum TaxID=390894 RepID=A0A6A6R503_9PEZI|nr:hypothetical protein BU16DRAFT_275724 [Lophium mytilinum]
MLASVRPSRGLASSTPTALWHCNHTTQLERGRRLLHDSGRLFACNPVRGLHGWHVAVLQASGECRAQLQGQHPSPGDLELKETTASRTAAGNLAGGGEKPRSTCPKPEGSRTKGRRSGRVTKSFGLSLIARSHWRAAPWMSGGRLDYMKGSVSCNLDGRREIEGCCGWPSCSSSKGSTMADGACLMKS